MAGSYGLRDFLTSRESALERRRRWGSGTPTPGGLASADDQGRVIPPGSID